MRIYFDATELYTEVEHRLLNSCIKNEKFDTYGGCMTEASLKLSGLDMKDVSMSDVYNSKQPSDFSN